MALNRSAHPATALVLVALVACGLAALALPGAGPVRAVAAPPALLPAPSAAPSEVPTPGLRRSGTTGDGWAVYRLTERVPGRLAVGEGFRGEITWSQGGLARKARVYVPRTAPAAAPLLVSLHGLGASLHTVEKQQRWSTLAFQQRFVLVWGAGHRSSWNAGPCCGEAARAGVDDLAYVDRLVEVVGALHGLDRRRLHLAGFSNGAMLAYRYACERPGRIAGLLAVAGTHIADCEPSAASAVLSVHGDRDPTVPLHGTAASAQLGTALPPVRRGTDLWSPTGAGVRSVVLAGVGHAWPTTRAGGYDTTGEGWRFLEGHPLP